LKVLISYQVVIDWGLIIGAIVITLLLALLLCWKLSVLIFK